MFVVYVVIYVFFFKHSNKSRASEEGVVFKRRRVLEVGLRGKSFTSILSSFPPTFSWICTQDGSWSIGI